MKKIALGRDVISSVFTVFKPFVLLSLVIFIFTSCKKDTTSAPKNKPEQYFISTIDNQQISISSKDFEEDDLRSVLRSQYTIRGFEAHSIEDYDVQVRIPNVDSGDVFQTLRFNISDVKTGSFHLNGESTIYDDNGSFVTFREGASNVIFYKSHTGGDPASNPDVIRYISLAEKKPFEIIVDKYEFVAGSATPTVGGRLNGILYNTENVKDSVAIKNGTFEIRY